jgi:hypothetical protein
MDCLASFSMTVFDCTYTHYYIDYFVHPGIQIQKVCSANLSFLVLENLLITFPRMDTEVLWGFSC